MRIRKAALFLAVSICNLVPLAAATSDTTDTSFQLSPAPIPYPVFSPGATDGKVDLSYIKMTISDYSLNGLSLFAKGRQAFSELLALDAMAGLMYMSGQMPGMSPIVSLPAYSSSGSFLGYYTPIPASRSTFTAMNINLAGNVELQAVKTPAFALIFFAGPNMNVTSLTFKTPFNAYYAPTGTTYTGYTDTLTMSILLLGLQGGVQLDIPLGSMIRLSPFILMTSMSGSMTMTDSPNTKYTGQSVYSYEVPSSTAVSTGFDIFIDNISLGAMAQSSKSATTGRSNSYLQLTVGFRFGSDPAKDNGFDDADDGWKTEGDAQPAAKEQKKK